MGLNLNAIYSVAKKEFSDNVRSKWIIAMTIIFVILTIAASFLAGQGDLGGMEATVTSILSISSALIPLIAIMLGYGTISGEGESGSLYVLLFCAWIAAMGYLHYSFVLAYLGAITSLVLTALFLPPLERYPKVLTIEGE